MPKMIYTDDEGNEVTVEATPDQVKEWQEKATKAETLEKTLSEKEAELAKLSAKEMNFSKFREKTEQEKEDFREKLTAEQRMVLDEVTKLREERDTERAKNFQGATERILKSLVGDNEDLKKSIIATEKGFAGTAENVEDLERRYRNSFILVQGAKPTVRPLFNFSPSLGSDDPDLEPKDFVQTERGKENYKSLFGHYPGEKF